MQRLLLALTLATLALGGCATRRDPACNLPPTPFGINARSGAEQAICDILEGRVRVMEAGTRAVNAPGVPTGRLWDKLPRHLLPNGCDTPEASAWMRYAEAYNHIVVVQLCNQKHLGER